MDRSDLLEWAHHEHEHLGKLFEDLKDTFSKLESDGFDSARQRDEALNTALDDLEHALDDMLEHFSEEEEVFFVEIEQRFPEFEPQIEALIATHEQLCSYNRTLMRRLGAEREVLFAEIKQTREVLDALVDLLHNHNQQEQEVFVKALQRLSDEERDALLATKQQLG